MPSFVITLEDGSLIRESDTDGTLIPPPQGLSAIPPLLVVEPGTTRPIYIIPTEVTPSIAPFLSWDLNFVQWLELPDVAITFGREIEGVAEVLESHADPVPAATIQPPAPAPAAPEQQISAASSGDSALASSGSASAYTIVLEDNAGLLAPAVREEMTDAVDHVVHYLDTFIDWQGSIDITVRIKSHDEQVAEQGSDIDGMTCATEGSWFYENGWKKSNLIEGTTGNDRNGSAPDAGFTIYLAEDGTIRNYGAPVWIDPRPEAFVTPAIPDGAHDFVSIVLHELMHNLAFDGIFGDDSPFWSQVQEIDGEYLFQGPTTVALLGEGLPIELWNHIPADFGPVTGSDLMRSIGIYSNNRWDMGRIELAVLQDLGWAVIDDWSGIPMADMVDYSPHLTGTAGDDALFGDFHDNSLAGVGGRDTLEGGAGNDLLGGAGGADLLIGGAGEDALYGGGGNDRYGIDDSDILVEHAGKGMDTVVAACDFRLPANFESLTLAGGASIDGTGNAAANTIIGNGAGNTLAGSGGADTLRGEGGVDVLRGGAGDDALIGGAGRDKFDFNAALDAATNVDRVIGFSTAADEIRLDNDLFVGLAVGILAPQSLYQAPGAVRAQDPGDRVVYNTETGRLYFDADGAGGAAATLFAILAGAPAVAVDDFVVIA